MKKGITESVSTDGNKRLGGEKVILCDVTEIFDVGLQAPIPFILRQQFVFVEKSDHLIPVRKRKYKKIDKREAPYPE